MQGRVCTKENKLRIRSQVCRGGPAPVPADPCLAPPPPVSAFRPCMVKLPLPVFNPIEIGGLFIF